MKKLTVKLIPEYDIYIGNQILDVDNTFINFCKNLNKKCVIITDNHLENTIGKNIQEILDAPILSFAAGDNHKSRETKKILEDKLLEAQYGRDTCLIALGGGVVTDLVGFIAATYCRGVPVVYLPTTLLAMVDASIGGKTGVNTPFGKNLIGAFYQPKAVFIDTHFLESLPVREWHNGMVEVIKHSIIADADIFMDLKNGVSKIKSRHQAYLAQIIFDSCLIKKNIIEQDEKELGMRQLLNFGHTIGHAIETLENYEIHHGEAVAIGMIVEAYISLLCGYCRDTTLTEIMSILKLYELPLKTKAFQQKDKLIALLSLDKKALGKTARFVLLDAIGKPHIERHIYSHSVEPVILNQALDWAAEYFEC